MGHQYPDITPELGVPEFRASISKLCKASSTIELRELTSESGDGTIRSYYLAGPVELPINLGRHRASFQWYVGGSVPDERLFARQDEQFLTYEHCLELSASLASRSVLVLSEKPDAMPLVRVHSCCTTGDLFGSERCDCGDQLKTALAEIALHGTGMLVYDASHEGRGIGLLGKMLAYSLQEAGADTYAANDSLGFLDDQREFEFAAAVVGDFYADRRIELLTNNPAKLALIRRVVPDVLRVPLHGKVTSANALYLQAKHAKGHLMSVDQDTSRTE
jgi:GTP cyclohydrolase II